ncbi:SRPBCC family protein [Oxalicibacterium faecigallinarum]|uniref:Activator of HSP90 ATPase n=1 Tax=Oxalicibacterium faecigallinarum TaxID=573741 RepID=A0A8J3AVS1_9BURK|nr:SRPBCC family protein [Oxalicibacterium faecigallinarum]GGI17486.1 activator of HSP90 ATPase [Oxalicibacterium faecigallinarum]
MTTATPADRTLILSRTFDAPPALVFKAWTDPALLKQWFVPRPWSIARVENDVRAGGSNLIVMRDPDGNEYPNQGIYLDVIPNERLVFTDAYISAWLPSEKPFMTGIITFEAADGGRKTKYTARVVHWRVEDREAHEKMGFHEGWGKCADQLAELLATL